MRTVTPTQTTFTYSFKDVVTGSEILVDGITAKPGGGLLTGTDSPGGGGGLFNSTAVLKPKRKQGRGRKLEHVSVAPTYHCPKLTPAV